MHRCVTVAVRVRYGALGYDTVTVQRSYSTVRLRYGTVAVRYGFGTVQYGTVRCASVAVVVWSKSLQNIDLRGFIVVLFCVMALFCLTLFCRFTVVSPFSWVWW